MKQYLELIQLILKTGSDKSDRTGTGTRAIFGHQMRFDLNEGFPLVTTKQLHTKSIIHELLWFIKGDTNIQYLRDNKVRIWDEWADDKGDLGPIYGAQWRAWQTKEGAKIDQLSELIAQIKHTPDSRRLVMSAWNVGEINEMALPPCHLLCQFYVSKDKKLSCQLYQRSADIFLGVPFNIASYALLTHMIAAVCDLSVGDFIWTGGDCHLYRNHFEQAQLQLERTPLPLAKLHIKRTISDINAFIFDDFEIQNYQHHAPIKGAVSV